MPRWALAFALLLASALAAPAQQEGTYVVPRFRFEGGGEIGDLKVGYVTWGKLNAARDNAVLLLPATNAFKTWAAYHIGPGKAFDPDKHFVIGVDPIGSGTSSKPADGLGIGFPAYTIRDMVRAQHELVTKGLGIEKLLSVGGASMGAFQGVEWGINYPDSMRGLLLWVPAARSDRHFHIIMDAVAATITLDPAYRDGRYEANPVEGMRRAGMIYFPWLYSDAYLRRLTDDAEYDKAKMAFGEGWARLWDANTLLWRYKASRNHDAAKPFGGDMTAALARIRVPALIMPSTSDRTVPAYLTDELVNGLHKVTYAPIQSERGHLAYLQGEGTPEYEHVSAGTKSFLEVLAGERPTSTTGSPR